MPIKQIDYLVEHGHLPKEEVENKKTITETTEIKKTRKQKKEDTNEIK